MIDVNFFGTTDGDINLTINETNSAAFGGEGNDMIKGTALNASKASASNNRLYGGSGDDIIYVENGDVVFGEADNDIIINKGGQNNILVGGQGDDEIFGGSRDLLVGGAGADKFYIADGEAPIVANTVLDFTKGQDKIVISIAGVTADGYNLTASNGDTLVQLANNTTLSVIKGVTGLVKDTDVIIESPLSTATVIQTGSTISDFVNNFNTLDYYKFSLGAEKQVVTIDVTGLEQTTTLTLHNSQGNPLDSETQRVGDKQQIKYVVDGNQDYFITVNGRSNITNYSLKVDTALASTLTIDGAGQITDEALPLDISSGSITKAGSFSNLNFTDIYSFEITNESDVTISLNGLDFFNNAELELTNSNGDILGAVYRPNGNNVTISQPYLKAGTYYLSIQNTTGVAEYSLNINATLTDGSTAGANQLTVGQTFSNSGLNSADIIDYYKFTVPNTVDAVKNPTNRWVVTVDVTGLENTTILNLLKDNGNELINETAVVGEKQEIKFVVDGGQEYFVGVNGSGTLINGYDIVFNHVERTLDNFTIDNAGQNADPGVALDLGTIDLSAIPSGSFIQEGLFSNINFTDVYKFTVATTGNYTITLNDGSTNYPIDIFNNAEIELTTGDLTTINAAYNEDGSNPSITAQLTASTDYFLFIQNTTGVAEYDLTITVA